MISTISESEYSQSLENYDDKTPFHKINWLNTVKNIYSVSLLYLALYENSRQVALLPVFKRRLGITTIYGLPLSQIATPAIFPLVETGKEAFFLRSLTEWIRENKITYFQLAWNNKIELKEKNMDIEIRDNLEVSLMPDIDGIIKNIKSEARTRIRKAVRSGVKVHWASEHKFLAAYNKLLQSTYARQNIKPNFPEKFYERLFHTSINEDLKVVYATYNNEIIAALWILFDKYKCYFWDGASNQEFRKLSANHLLHWEITRWAKNRNLKYYDMIGRSKKSGRSGARPGIGRFKMSLGAKSIEYNMIYWKRFYFSLALKIYRKMLSFKNNPGS